MNDEISLIDIIKIINKYKKMIVWLFVIAVIAAFVFSKVSPKEYKGTATILPLESSTGGLASALGAITGAPGGGAGQTKIIAVLKSKTLAKQVITELDLLKIIYSKKWDESIRAWKDGYIPSLENAADSLSKNIDIKTDKEGVVSIAAEWDDPLLAAGIPNKYVEKLSDFLNNRSLGVTFQTIDQAVPPERPFKPRTLMNMLLAGVASLFIGVTMAFLIDYFKNMPTT
jgi:uncharacterized protein involved in exopolysaccharide biosynthesis